ncbi:DUF2721 domain-containing protein [Humisphaera borealis]|uniref:DUF2721 domain-containing protein n=1 Tax=Humisphaera borealis TaxID=2807512 RepID=A0A7M2WWU8_9BACT|nr:DUF2721 domain-containing protein [Humisphaera borealis]QOV89869.1 DUF2721 domain-containing protein [Humisphaera borealis]
MSDNPFAVLTLIGAPAILTNASSLLALGTSNRFARAVDRQRQLSSLLEKDNGKMDQVEANLRLTQLHWAEARGQLLLKALTSIYLSLGAFAAASLLSLMGALIGDRAAYVSFAAGILAILAGLVGVGGLVAGSVRLVRETRIALQSLKDEAAFTTKRFESRHLPPV